MSEVETNKKAELERVLAHIRSAVRRERPYVVGGVANIRVKLNQNECPLDLPEALKRELIEAFFHTPFNRYPTEQPDRLCHALGAYVGWDPDGILVGKVATPRP